MTFEQWATKVKAYRRQQVNWLEVSSMIKYSGFNDPEFDLKNIRGVPLASLNKILEFAAKTIKTRENLQQAAVANLGVLIYRLGVAALQVDNPKPVSLYDFLPYPELDDTPRSLSEGTKRILKEIIRGNSLLARRITPMVGKI